MFCLKKKFDFKFIISFFVEFKNNLLYFTLLNIHFSQFIGLLDYNKKSSHV